jgi:glyoxylase-like metal-dependent hydrolase (beta-lactamase superfamily II)
MGTCVSGQSGDGRTLRKAFRSVLTPMRDRFTLLAGDHEIVPGIEAQLAPGHSPGHVVIPGRRAHTGDSFLRAPNVSHPDWTATFDLRPDQVRETRRRLLR